MPETKVENNASQLPDRRPKQPIFQAIGFAILWLVSLGIMIVGSIMAATNFSFGENPHYNGKFIIDLSVVVEGEDIPSEKEEIVLGTDASGLVEIYVLDDLPLNIIESETVIHYIKIDGQNTGDEIIFGEEKRYVVTYDAYIKYDMVNVMIRSGLQSIALVLVTFGVIWYVVEQNKRKDAQYNKEKAEIEKTSGYYLPIVWQSYEDSTNEKRKIKQWRAWCVKQENLLDKRKRFMTKKQVEEYENHLRIWIKGTEQEKEKDSYCVKKARLRLYQTDAWIKENLQFKLVKYDPISYRLVFTGKDIRNQAENPNEYITKNVTMMIILDNLPRLVIGLGVSITLTMLVIDIISLDITVILSALLGLGNMAWNSYLSITYARNLFNNVTFGDICFRSGIAKEYSSYLTNHRKEPDLPKVIATKTEDNKDGSAEKGNPSPNPAT